MRRKILGILGAILLTVGYMNFINLSVITQPVAAAGCSDSSFLGFRPWYQGLGTDSGGSCELRQVCEKPGGCGGANEIKLSTFIWTAVLNIIFDISLAVGYIAVGIVIYGGYLYMMSQGDPGKMMGAKKTLTSAVIGVVIAMGATILVNTAKVILGIDESAGWNQGSFGGLQQVFDWAYLAAGIVAVAFIIKNGVDYMISIGDPGKIQRATRGLIAAIAGLVVVVLAAVITNFIIKSVGGAM